MPFVVPNLSTSSSITSTPTSSSSSKDSVFDVSRYSENPVPERSESVSEELRRNPLHESTETENKNNNEGREEIQSDLLHDLPDWLQEFRENLVDERSPSERRWNPELGYRDTSSSSHGLLMESRAKVEPVSGEHSCLQDPNCDICLKTKVTRASCRRRAGTVVPKAEHFGDLITADHKILSEGSTSVVTILHMWNKNFPGDPEEPNEFPGADEETKSHLHWQFLGIWEGLWGIILESLYVNTTQIRNIWDCWKCST